MKTNLLIVAMGLGLGLVMGSSVGCSSSSKSTKLDAGDASSGSLDARQDVQPAGSDGGADRLVTTDSHANDASHAIDANTDRHLATDSQTCLPSGKFSCRLCSTDDLSEDSICDHGTWVCPPGFLTTCPPCTGAPPPPRNCTCNPSNGALTCTHDAGTDK